MCLLELGGGAGEGPFGALGAVAERQQDLALAFELLDQVDLEIGTAGHFEHLEQRDEGYMVFEGAFRADEVGNLLEQILQAEERADPLVERIFVGDHARA